MEKSIEDMDLGERAALLAELDAIVQVGTGEDINSVNIDPSRAR